MQKLLKLLMSILCSLFFIPSITNAQVKLVIGGWGTNPIASSYDGISWTGRGTGIFDGCNSVAYRETFSYPQWVAGGYGNNTIAYSYDGNYWYGIAASLFDQVYSVEWNGTLWVAVGSGANSIAYSYDGINWYGLGTEKLNSGMSVAWNGTMWIAVGSGCPQMSHSYDGINWMSTYNANFGITCQVTFQKVVWEGNRWFILGNGPTQIASSTDGINWSGGGLNIFGSWGTGKNISWNGSIWVAVGSGSDAIATSSDGITWISRGSNTFSGASDVSWNGTMWVAVGSGSNSIATSTDGITWTGQGKYVFQNGTNIFWNGTSWIACGYNKSIASSTNGFNWNILGSGILDGAITLASKPLPDTTPPTILCIGDQGLAATNASGVSAVLPDYRTQATVSDNFTSSTNINYIQNPGVNTLISNSQNVTLTATDQAGNSSTCSFLVTVTVTPLTGGTIAPSKSVVDINSPPTPVSNTMLAAGGTGVYTYQWYVSGNGSTWFEVPGATGASYTRSGISQTLWFRRKVTDMDGQTAFSNTSIIAFFSFIQHPLNQTVCEGDVANFSVECTGSTNLSFQWQTSTDENTWTAIPGATTANCSVISSYAMNGNYYRCVLSGGGNIFYSNSASITVKRKPVITQQPVSSKGGSSVFFYIEATGDNLQYQWQEKRKESSTWTNLDSENSSYLGVPLFASRDSSKFRCRISSDLCTTIYSNEAIATINIRPTIISRPTNQTICQGEDATFLLELEGDCTRIEWKKYVNGVCVNPMPGDYYVSFPSPNSSQLIVPAAHTEEGATYRYNVYGWQYPADDSYAIELAFFDGGEVSINVKQPPVGFPLTGNYNLFEYSILTLSANVTDQTLLLQWQESINNGATWSDIPGSNSKELNRFVNMNMEGYYYRCRATGLCGNPAYSGTYVLNVIPLPQINTQLLNKAVCEGNEITLSTSAVGELLTYQWYKSTDGVSWNEIIGAPSGVYSQLMGEGGTVELFKYSVTSWGTKTITSEPFIVTVKKNPSIQVQPKEIVGICQYDEANLSVSAIGDDLTYQWQSSNNNGQTWTDIPGANGMNYLVPTINTGWSDSYRCLISSLNCISIASDYVRVYVNDMPVISNSQSSTIYFCEGESTFLYVTIPTLYCSSVWQESVDGGISWTNLTNQSSTTLELNYTTINMSGNKYRFAVNYDSYSPVYSNPYTLIVVDKQEILSQSSDIYTAVGSNITLSMTTTDPVGVTSSYSWYKKSGGSWSVLPNSNSKTISFPATVEMNGSIYFGLISNVNGIGRVCDTFTRDITVTVSEKPALPDVPNYTYYGNSTLVSLIPPSSNDVVYYWQTQANGVQLTDTAQHKTFTSESTLYLRSRGEVPPYLWSDALTVNVKVYSPLSAGSVAPSSSVFTSAATPVVFTNNVSASGGKVPYTFQWQSSVDGSSWSSIPGENISSYTISALLQTSWFHLKVTDSNGNSMNSNDVLITVPSSVTGGTTSPATLTVTTGVVSDSVLNVSGSGGGTGIYDYLWQSSVNGTDWLDLSTTSTYTLPALTLTTRFRRKMTDKNTKGVAYSVPSVVTVNFSGGTITPALTTIPSYTYPGTISNVLLPTGGTGGYTYRWESSVDGGTSWIPISGADSINYTPSTLVRTTSFRRITKDQSNTEKSSNTIAITVTLSGGEISASLSTIESGTLPGTIMNSSAASGGSGIYTYQWQSSVNSTVWSDINETNSTDYTPLTLSQSTWFRRRVTDGINTEYSDTAAIAVTLSGGEISPSDILIKSGTSPGTISNSFNASGGSPVYNYQWEYSANGVTWTNISGAISTSYTPTTLNQTMYYRRKVTDSNNNVAYSGTSVAAVIFDGGSISPTTKSIASGTYPGIISNISTAIGGTAGYAYEWQKSIDGGKSWDKIPNESNSSYTPPQLSQTTRFRRKVTDSTNHIVYSNSSVISVTIPPVLSGGIISPPTLTVISGNLPGEITNVISVSGGIPGYTFQWQLYNEVSTSWEDIPGATNSTYTPLEISHSTLFRRQVKDSSNKLAYSNTSIITVTAPPVLSAGSISPATITITSGSSPGTITDGAAASGGTGELTYQWQTYNDESTSWEDIPNATNSTYTPLKLRQSTWFWRKVTDSVGNISYSNTSAVTVTLSGGTITPLDLDVKAGTSLLFSSNVYECASGGTGGYKYQWQSSINNGSSWTVIDGEDHTSYTSGAITQPIWFRRKVTDKSDISTYSNTSKVTLTFSGGLISPESITITSGSSPGTISCSPASNGVGTYRYQWEKSSDGGATWSNISGAISSNYSSPALTQRFCYRRKVTDSNNKIAYSNILYVKFYNSSVDNITPYIAQPVPESTNSSSVGSIAGQADVSPTGSATYQIPLAVAPGTAGMQPELSVVYNSQGGNGLLGMGFNLSGLSSISRVPKNIYNDGVSGGISLTSNDRFVLDGSRLIDPLNTYANTGTVYYPETNNTMRITSNGTAGNGPQWFQVETKDGKIIEYGNTPDSRITSSNGTVITWKINKVTDKNSNYALYLYNTNDDERPVSEIQYTGNTLAGKNPYNSVRFFYQRKTDAFKSYIVGQAFTNDILLKTIEVESENNLVRKYGFEYTMDNFSHLCRVTQSGAGGESLNPTIINWGANKTAIIPKTFELTDLMKANSTNEFYISGDVNNDGLSDLICFYDHVYDVAEGKQWQYIQVYKSTIENDSTIKFVQGESYKNNGSFIINDFRVFNSGVITGDVYGNGINKIITPTFYYPSANNSSLDLNIKSNINSITISDTLRYPMQTDSKEMPLFTTTDLNNNGKMDFVIVEKGKASDGNYVGGMIEAVSVPTINPWDGTSTRIVERYLRTFKFAISEVPKNIFTGDYNSDGFVDILIVTTKGIYTFANEDGYFNQTRKSYLPFNNFEYSIVREGDFNQDGIPDLLFSGYDNVNIKIAYSTGNYSFSLRDVRDFNAGILGLNDKRTEHDDQNDNIIVTDFNNDGKLDFVLFNTKFQFKKYFIGSKYIFKEFTTSWYQSTGTSFVKVKEQTSAAESDSYSKYFVGGDFNGDGRMDLINYGFECYNKSSTDKKWRMYDSFDSRFESQKVTKVVDGLKQSTEFTYRSLTYARNPDNTYFYEKGKSSPSHVIAIQAAIPVVSSLISPDGVGGSSTTNYTYKNAKVHLQGKGFLGFGETTASNAVANKKVTNTYGISSTYFVPELLQTKVATYDDFPISTTSLSSPVYKDLGNKRITVFSNSSIITDHIKDIKVDKSTVFDDYGNSLKTTIDYGASVGSVVTDNVFTPEGSWCDSRLSESTVTKIIVGSGETGPNVRKYKNTYDALGRMTSKINDPLKSKELTETYSDFDSWGNPQTVTLSASGLTSRNTKIEYDDLGRFVKKETNVLGHSKEYSYDGRFGMVLTEKAADGLTTIHEYDGFGKKKKSTLPDGRMLQYEYSWSSGGLSQGVFAVNTSLTGEPYVKTYYDALGRELRTETPSFTGITYVDKEYNRDGSLKRESLPYFTGDLANAKWTAYTYNDKYGRLTDQTFIDKKTEYNYATDNRKKVSVKLPDGNTSFKITDALGNVIQANDNGGDILYTYYNSGLVKTITSNGSVTEMHYDEYDRQDYLVDPDAGRINYTYNAFGEMVTQTDAENHEYKMEYDELGRLDLKTCGGKVTDYDYVNTTGSNGLGQILSVSGPEDNVSTTYSYDGFGRTTKVSENVQGQIFDTEYTYNATGRVEDHLFPSQNGVRFKTVNKYNSNGYLDEVQKADGSVIWKMLEANALGQVKQTKLGAALTTTKTYDPVYGTLKSIQTEGIQNNEYEFDPTTGNLNYRKDVSRNLKESFTYTDGLNRLNTVSMNGVLKQNFTYKPNGNIETKTGLGSYYYEHATKTHAVTGIDNTDNVVTNAPQDISYTSFNKVASIIENEGDKNLQYLYGPDQQRRRTVYTNGSLQKTTYFIGSYEKEISNGITKELHYIGGGDGLAAVYIKTNGTGKLYYILTDHLGSIQYICNESGGKLEEMSFDTWGRRRNPADWTYTNVTPSAYLTRGFTGHEHLDAFGLIDMNGRVYDPILGRFLSPDKYVQAPTLTQSFNRYSYCLNNPLIFTDPNGELWGLFAAYLGNYVAHWLDNTINKGMSPKQAFSQTPIMLSGNFNPSNMTQKNNFGFSNYQVNAQLMAKKDPTVKNTLSSINIARSIYGNEWRNNSGNKNQKSIVLETTIGMTGYALSAFDNAGGSLHYLRKSKIVRLYHDLPYVNQYTNNLEISRNGNALLFGIGEFNTYLKFRSGDLNETQFWSETYKNVLGSLSPQFGLMFMTFGAIEYINGKIDAFSKSSTANYWYDGMLEMTDPNNYGVPYDEY